MNTLNTLNAGTFAGTVSDVQIRDGKSQVLNLSVKGSVSFVSNGAENVQDNVVTFTGFGKSVEKYASLDIGTQVVVAYQLKMPVREVNGKTYANITASIVDITTFGEVAKPSKPANSAPVKKSKVAEDDAF
jgi:hypothetical protein